MAEDVLIVDDEEDIRSLCAGILEDEGFATRAAKNSDETFAAIAGRMPGLVLLDIWLQGSKLDGIEILEKIKAEMPEIPVVMMSGHGTVETAVKAIQQGAYDFIEKPFKADRLILTVFRAMEISSLRRENAALRRRADADDTLIGSSPQITHLRQAVSKAGPSNSRVLITGASGTGKEVVARALHQTSLRKEGPFAVVNCASITPGRMEMELFGSEEDAEGGRKVGTFEAAHNGTLLLDEVGDMPIETQGKIVRVLQDQIFERVGGGTPVQVDVRVVATTTRDLSEEISEGRFREDLFYRLSVVPLEVPALRERRSDIPDLAEYFMAQAAKRAGQTPRSFGEDALATMQAYNWPGNVRELRNIVERLLIMAPGRAEDHILADMLPQEISGRAPLSSDEAVANREVMGMPLRAARETFERDYLFAQIERFGGNVSKTATFVGMERSALHRKLKALGYQPDSKGGRE